MEIMSEYEYTQPVVQLGEGAFASVYKIRHKKDNKLFAMKVIDLNKLHKAELVNLKTEVEIQQKLNHPNIVKLYNHFELDNKYNMIFELCENQMLFFYTLNNMGISEGLAMKIFV